ncbi:MAG TPA: hypothetical protein IGS37_06720 [Synechococcales cyanobacterium M55_K2018_004]|nr:hypothetical protein [Synechococcales cyanobacterium M55_K2018_004]
MLKSGYAALCVLLLAGCATSTSVPDSVAQPSPQTSPRVGVTPTATPSIPTPGDLQVVPGDRFGPVTPATTRDDLARWYGVERLTDEEIPIGEGETQPGTVVNLGETQSFTVVWTDENRTKVDHIRNPGSAWKTPQGIGIGTAFDTLQQQLGPFQLYGFAWDYSGTVVLKNSNLANYDGLLILRLAPAAEAIEQAKAQYEAVMGDTLYDSTNPNLPPLNLKVEEMIVYLERSQS